MRSILLVFAFGCVEEAPEGQDGPTSSTSPFGPGGETGPRPPNEIVDQVVPLVGGGLAATSWWVAASDPDDDGVEFVHLIDSRKNQRIDLDPGSAPTVMAWTTTSPELLHVILRGNSSLLVLEPSAATGTPEIRALEPICDTPRGLGWDVTRERMWVACASGELVATTADGARLGSFWLGGDLRDVVVHGDGRALVSRQRGAEVLTVDLDAGAIEDVWSPSWMTERFGGETHAFAPGLVRRLVPSGPYGALALVQWNQESEIDVFATLEGDEPAPPSDGHVYGADQSDEDDDDCMGIIVTGMAYLSDVDQDVPYFVRTVDDFPVDVLYRPSDEPVLATARSVYTQYTSSIADIENGSELCLAGHDGALVEGMPTAVTMVGDQIWVATREPFFFGPVSSVAGGNEPPEGSRSGLVAFHQAPAGIACASCHPDGGDDGFVWPFSTGERKTMSLGGIGIGDTAPFHWNGDLASLSALLDDVAIGRMGLEPFSASEEAALSTFLNRLPRPAIAGPPPDAAVVAKGAALFADPTLDCTTCHSGPFYTNGLSADVGTGGEFQVPSLIGVGSRLPLMHDGCASSIRERFDRWTCGGSDHGDIESLTSPDVDALVVFLSTL